MKRALLISAVFAAVGLGQEPTLPRKAPDLGIQTAQNEYLWLSQYSGKTCVVTFILTSCPHCQYTIGVLNNLARDYAPKGVQFLASAIDPMSSLYIPEFKKKFSPAFPIGYNEQGYIAKFLGLPPNDPMLVPQVVFVDHTGIIRAQVGGDDASMNKDVQEKTLREILEKTLKGQTTPRPPAPK